MKKVVLKLDVHDGKCKQKAMKMVSAIPGLESMAVDMKESKMTLIGDIDPVAAVTKLRKTYHAEIISVGPAKEPEKKKEEPKKEEPKKQEEPKKKEEPKKEAQVVHVIDPVKAYQYQMMYPHIQYAYPTQHYYARGVEEDPNSCVIC